ncbi:MAG TPA: bifunctional diaminohydroxyphosphoribosylaminopyrimidine deaminase/5-amino-6-(5-phosphoribosylamino)uracil reductase RibD [Rhodanobacteraceae bacterium]
MAFSATDKHHMARALELARNGLFSSMPNPRVGCVVVRDGAVVGEGWHPKAGEPHAEVFALRDAGGRAQGATAYVTLEPCSHQGRTPPCAQALVQAGVARVVIASTDTNPKAAGGIATLREAGIPVETGLLDEAARELNVGFFSRVERGRPFVRVKLAMSLDGRTALADGQSQWITGEAARHDVQLWRARASAILTGAGTARADNPRLTLRLSPEDVPRWHPDMAGAGAKPLERGDGGLLRVVLDTHLDALAADAHVLDGQARTLVLHAPGAKPADARYAKVETQAVACDAQGRLALDAVLHELAARGCNEVQVEAGATLCGALLQTGLVDELLLYIAPVLLGGTARPLLALPPLASMSERWHLALLDQVRLGDDVRLRLRPEV